MNATVILKKGRERSLVHRHPWVFSGAVGEIRGDGQAGDVVDVVAQDGSWLGQGFLNPNSDVVVRVVTWDEGEQVTEELIRKRIEQAWQRRLAWGIPSESDAFRVIYSESDFLPGLIADKYADFVVVQLLTPAMERWKDTVVSALWDVMKPKGVFERSDTDTREREGLPMRTGILKGDAPPPELVITEHGKKFLVNIYEGQKTGFYLDQRENRQAAVPFISSGTILNAFSYTGSFAVYAVKGGAERAINVDTSKEALMLAGKNAKLNRVGKKVEHVEANSFQQLRRYRDAGMNFDAIILDPPRFAHSKAHLESACRGYKDINLLAMKLLKPGGTLVTFSCSGLVDAKLFQQILFAAALDANREALILQKLGQAKDHPVLATFPESDYLKGFICQMV